MSDKPNGGPAFPCELMNGGVAPDANGINRYLTDPRPGMTLRDWFAGMAMQGFMQTGRGAAEILVARKEIAAAAYEVADAMIKEGAK